MDRLIEWFEGLAPWEMLAYAVGVGLVLQFLVAPVLLRIARKTRTTVDDQVIGALRAPLFVTFLLIGIGFAVQRAVDTSTWSELDAARWHLIW